MIRERLLEAAEKSRHNMPCYTNRASEMGHDCLRYLYYNRTRWQERALPSPELQMIFQAGTALEGIAVRRLEDAGIEILQRQTPLVWEQYQITGTIDGMVECPDRKLAPLEIKHLNMFDFAKLNEISDFMDSSKYWLRKYPTQLALYMLMKSAENGCLLIFSKQDYSCKEFWFKLDDILEIGEAAIKKAEAVNAAIAGGYEPPRKPFDEDCLKCGFWGICFPPQDRQEALAIDDSPALIEACLRYHALEAQLEPLNELDKEQKAIKEQIKEAAVRNGKETLLAGDTIITLKTGTRKAYTVKEAVTHTLTIKHKESNNE
jgi:CRISPR/Cas system-associated exonuclease Cas4 (RecB family)